MKKFQDVKLSWKGDVYTVKAENIMRLIAKLEAEISLAELSCIRGTPPLAKLSIAYAIALDHAGADVTAEDVYFELFEGDSANVASIVSGSITGLMMLMTPPATYEPHIKKGAEAKA